MPARTPAIADPERIGQFILVIRSQRVLIDEDLAVLDGVETRSLRQAVKRNLKRFPPDSMFELSAAECFEIPICDLKTRSRWSTLCPYAGCGDAVISAQQQHGILLSQRKSTEP
jgi:hypothetical protein